LGPLQFRSASGGLNIKPQRENGVVELLDKILDKGVILNADLIISVAGIPLIGVALKAAIASIETMLNYGMMEAWDKSTREWYTKASANKKEIALKEEEQVLFRTFGSLWYSQGQISTWKPGFWYLTNERFILWRKSPPETLFEVQLKNLEDITTCMEPHFAGERENIYLQFDEGQMARIHTLKTDELKEALEKATEKSIESRAVHDSKIQDGRLEC